VARKLGSADVIDVLADLFIARGTPGHIRSDNGPKFMLFTLLPQPIWRGRFCGN
jgi:hypothetical protein